MQICGVNQHASALFASGVRLTIGRQVIDAGVMALVAIGRCWCDGDLQRFIRPGVHRLAGPGLSLLLSYLRLQARAEMTRAAR